MFSSLNFVVIKIVVILCLSAAISLFTDRYANALTITEIDPFTGNHTEDWESFVTGALADGAMIFGGEAAIFNPNMVVYEPGVLNYGIGSSGAAQVADGLKGLGVNSGSHGSNPAVIEFFSPVSSFGGFWGASTPTGPSPSTVFISFFRNDDPLLQDPITIESFSYPLDLVYNGELEWHGWSSTEPFSFVSYANTSGGNLVVNDGLQAMQSNVIPEPNTMMLFCVGLLGLTGLRRKIRKE